MNRESELRLIEKHLRDNEIKYGPTAFVARTIQASDLTREFKHSNVMMKNRHYTFKLRK